MAKKVAVIPAMKAVSEVPNGQRETIQPPTLSHGSHDNGEEATTSCEEDEDLEGHTCIPADSASVSSLRPNVPKEEGENEEV